MSPRAGLLSLIGITVVWGTSFAVVKDALETIPVPLLLALRLSLACLCFIWVRFDRRALVPALVLGLLAFAGFATQTIGLSLTTASKAAFITGLSVVLTPLVAAAWKRRPLEGRTLMAALIAMGGLALLSFSDGTVAGSPGGWRPSLETGDLWVLGTAVSYAFYIVYLGEVAGKANGLALAGMQHLPMAGLAWAWAWPVREALWHTPLSTYLAIVYLAVVCTAVVAVIQTYAQRVVSASLAALIFVLEPVFATFFAYLWLGEQLTAVGWLGGGLVVLAMLVSELRLRGMRTRA